MIVWVRYVDGLTMAVRPHEWPELQSHGVDWAELHADDKTAERIQGRSVYWLYPEGDSWVIGGGSVGDPQPIDEVIRTKDSWQYRQPRYMPDLTHDQVKLGWWLPEGDD